MTKTQNYQLPQWVKEDRIMMDDFNEMCANIEKGLTAAKSTADSAESKADGNSAALESKAKELQAALDKQKQELQSAITSGDSALRGSLNTTSSGLSSLQSTVNSHTGNTSEHAFVKLGSVTATGSGGSFSSSLSGYSMLLLDCHFQDGDHRVKVTFNGSAELTLFNGSLALYHAVAFLFPVGSSAVGCSAMAVSDGGELAGGGTASGVSWPSVRTMSFSTAGKDATITIYGIRK